MLDFNNYSAILTQSSQLIDFPKSGFLVYGKISHLKKGGEVVGKVPKKTLKFGGPEMSIPVH